MIRRSQPALGTLGMNCSRSA